MTPEQDAILKGLQEGKTPMIHPRLLRLTPIALIEACKTMHGFGFKSFNQNVRATLFRRKGKKRRKS